MATANHARVGGAMELLPTGLAPIIAREVTARFRVWAVRKDAIRRLAEWSLIPETRNMAA